MLYLVLFFSQSIGKKAEHSDKIYAILSDLTNALSLSLSYKRNTYPLNGPGMV